jgi:hypothetical protein
LITFIPVKNSLRKFHSAVFALIRRHPRLYLAVVSLIAIIGFAYVLAFPLVTLISLVNIFQAAISGIADSWHQVLTWTSILILSGIVTYRAARLRTSPPSGITLSEDKAPELFAQVRVLHARYKRPEIRRIVITARYEVDIIKTPRWALPIWSSNTMVIGLPVLQCLSPQQLDCMVARRIGQFSKRDNLLTNWHYQLRQAWQQIRTATVKYNATGIEPLRWFFAVYAPLYSNLSAHAASCDELHADSYAMQLYNDQEVLNMITADALCRWYLEKRYWSAVYKISAAGKNALPAPHSKMAAAIRANLKDEKLPVILREVLKHEPRWNDRLPSLKSRIENIGHNKPLVSDFSGKTAGEHYLGKSLDGVITAIDKRWKTALINKYKIQGRQREFRAAGGQASSA